MRIAFVDYVGDPAAPGRRGLSDLVWDIARRLARLGDEVHIVAPYTTDVMPDPSVKVHRFDLPPIGYRNIIGHLLIIQRALQTLRAHGPFDVIHTPEYVSSALIAPLLRNTPVVFTEPGNIYERIENGNPYDWVTTQVYKLAANISARNVARCIATSDLMAYWWRRTGVPAERIARIPLGVDLDLFRRIPDARQKLGWDARRPIVLYAARLSRENGIEVALRGMAKVREVFPNVQLHVLGAGQMESSARRLASELGMQLNTVWHNWVDFHDLPMFYSAADALLFSGFSGGTPRVMLQAMACGTPVVASSIGGIVDHVEDGLSGLLFPAGNTELLAKQVLRVLEDRRLADRLSRTAFSHIERHVDWNVVIQEIRAVYAAVAARRLLPSIRNTTNTAQ